MPSPDGAPGPSVSVVVAVGGSCVLRYSRPPPPAPPPPWGHQSDPQSDPEIRSWGQQGDPEIRTWGHRGDPQGDPQSDPQSDPEIRNCRGDLLLLLRSLGPAAPPQPLAVTSFVGPEPRELLSCGEQLQLGSTGRDLGWAQTSPPFWVELPRGPAGFGFSLQGGPSGVFVRGLRQGGPAERCGCIQVSDELLAINGSPTAGMSHAQALARIRQGGSRVRLLLRRARRPAPPPARGSLQLRVGSSRRGELCFCLVGGLQP